MIPRALTSLVSDLRREFRTRRAVLRAVARGMLERRDVPAPQDWARLTNVNADFESLLLQDDALGVVYQSLNARTLESAYRATAREGRRFTTEEIPAVTGLFTPPWVADLLALDALRRRQGDAKVKEVRVLDPACGTMNFGLAAIDVLREMYREEMGRAGQPGWPAEPSVRNECDIGPAILQHNLFGADVDPTALWLARLTLGMKLRIDADGANLKRADALFDDIGNDFDVVLTNPPYLSARNLPAVTVARLKKSYPLAWRDLYACFIDRCVSLCRQGGRAGLLTMQSFMFTSAFEGLRASIAERAAIESIVHIGPGLFPTGNPGTLQTVAFTLRRESDATKRAEQSVTAVRLVEFPDASAKQNALREPTAPRFTLSQSELTALPRRVWSYDSAPAVRSAFSRFPKLRELAPPRQGLATTDNARFVRYWWEVDRGAASDRWIPYAKSGRFRRWYESPRHRVNWQDDGREIKAEILRRYPYLDGKWQWVAKNASCYGRAGGITYSYLTSGRFSARRLETGSIFDVAGSSLFPDDPLAILAILNSSTASQLLRVINPTLNFQVGDLAELPVPAGGGDALRELARRAVEIQQQLDTFDETTPDFRQPPAWSHAEELIDSLYRQLHDVERNVDAAAGDLYGIAPETNGRPHPTFDRLDLARRCVSFALGRLLARGGVALQIRPATPEVLAEIRTEFDTLAGPIAVDEIESTLGGLSRFLSDDFYAWHVKLYARRPVYWAFGDADRAYLLRHDDADAANVSRVLRGMGETLPEGWDRFVDDGIAVNLAPLLEWVADAGLAKSLRPVAGDLREGRLAWSKTAKQINRGSTGQSACVRSSPGRRGRVRSGTPA